MERLTTDNPRNNTEMALNLVYVKDGQAWVRNGGPCPGYSDVTLYDYMRLIIAEHGPMSIKTGLTDDELGDALDDALFDGIETKEGLCAMLYTLAWAFAELRQRLAAYEDTGLTPAQIKYILPKQSAEEAVKRMIDEKERYDEWFPWKQAEAEGRLVVLPCKVGDTVYTNIAMSGWHLRSRNRPYSAKVVFIGINANDGMGGGLINVTYNKCCYMMKFYFSDIGKTVFLTREEAEKALEGMGNDCD